jgi:hypothetical protein
MDGKGQNNDNHHDGNKLFHSDTPISEVESRSLKILTLLISFVEIFRQIDNDSEGERTTSFPDYHENPIF